MTEQKHKRLCRFIFSLGTLRRHLIGTGALNGRKTVNGALQEYERHFSGIWGHFPECRIFCHKSTKFTHTSFLQDELQYSLIQYPLPPSQMHESLTSTSCIIFSSLQLASSVRAKDLYNLIFFGIHETIFAKESILLSITLATFYLLK